MPADCLPSCNRVLTIEAPPSLCRFGFGPCTDSLSAGNEEATEFAIELKWCRSGAARLWLLPSPEQQSPDLSGLSMPKNRLTRAQRTALAAERRGETPAVAASDPFPAAVDPASAPPPDDRAFLSLSFDETDSGDAAQQRRTTMQQLNAAHPLTLVPLDVWRLVFARLCWRDRRAAAHACRALHRAAMGSLRSVRLLKSATLPAIKALAELPLLEKIDFDGHKGAFRSCVHPCSVQSHEPSVIVLSETSMAVCSTYKRDLRLFGLAAVDSRSAICSTCSRD